MHEEARDVRARLLTSTRVLRSSRGPEVRSALRQLSERRHRTEKLRTTVGDLERLSLPAQVAMLRAKLEQADQENQALRALITESRERERSALLMVETLTETLSQLARKANEIKLGLLRAVDPVRSARSRAQASRRCELRGEWEHAFLATLESSDGAFPVSRAYALREAQRQKWSGSVGPEAAAARLLAQVEEDPDQYYQFEDARVTELETRWAAEQASQAPGESPP